LRANFVGGELKTEFALDVGSSIDARGDAAPAETSPRIGRSRRV